MKGSLVSSMCRIYFSALKWNVGVASIAGLLLAALLVALPSSLGASDTATVNLTTKIKSVTIYKTGEAQVLRVGTVEVPEGEFTVKCVDLPWGLDTGSLEVSAYGNVEAGLYGVDVKNCYDDIKLSDRYERLKEKLDELEEKKTQIENKINSLDRRREFLSAIGSYSSDQAHRELASQASKPEKWKALLDFFESEHMGIYTELSGAIKRKEEVSKEIDKIQDEIDDLNFKGRDCREVYLECASPARGEITFEIQYIIRNANWNPEYKVKLDKEKDLVYFSYLARVKQQTGEDWQGVVLTLSTAKPARGAEPPKISPYEIPRSLVRRSKSQAILVTEPKSGVVKTGDELHVRAGRGGNLPFYQSTAQSSQFATNFSIARTVDLMTGSQSRLLLIKEDELKGTFSLYAAPAVSKHAYIRGKFKNDMEVPILSGPCAVYVLTGGRDGRITNFVGKERLGSVAQGEEFALYFGVDQDIKIDKKRVKREVLSRGKDSKKKVRYSYLITVQSFKKEGVSIELKDRIPVSRAKDVRVSDVDISPKPDKKESNGILTWNLKLDPAVKYEIKIEYSITYPVSYPDSQIE